MILEKFEIRSFLRRVRVLVMTASLMISGALPVLAYEGDDEAIIDMSPFLDLIKANMKVILPVFLIVLAIFIIILWFFI